MNWLARLKKTGIAPESGTTKPTKGGFVGFAGPIPASIQKTGGEAGAANDPTAMQTIENNQTESSDSAPDLDRWCWPHSEAMNTGEVDTFTARLHQFTGRGLVQADAERLADRLVKRDREGDDRRLCLECTHLAGNAPGAWACKNWQRAGVAVRARDAQLSAALVYQPQRCDGFNEQHHTR